MTQLRDVLPEHMRQPECQDKRGARHAKPAATNYHVPGS